MISVIGSWSNWTFATPLQKEGSNRWFTELSLPPGEYHFRFMLGDSTDLHPAMVVSDKYEREELVTTEGQRVMCNKIRVDVAPAFYLFYATGWRRCTLMYKMFRDGSAVAMDDSPSRAEPGGENSHWKQAIIALPAGVDASDRDSYSMQFFMQGPQLSDSSDNDNAGGSKDSGRRRSLVHTDTGNGNGKQQDGEAAAAARWFAPLADTGVPGDLRSLVKVDTPDKQSASACYQLRWPGGWKLQKGTITKFPCVTKPPVLLCADIDGTMVNEHSDKQEQFWMDSRTKEFQEYWESNAALARSVLVFNTGRSKGQLIWLLKEKPMLAVPDVLITAVGTKDPTEVEWIEDTLWSKRLDEGWDLAQALSAAGEMFKLFNSDSSERVKWLDKGQEHPHRVALQVHTSVLDDLVEQLQEAIDKRQLQARIIVSGAGDWRYVDVVHRLAGKLEALEWVRAVYGVPLQRCATAGDSCNDILMLDGKMPGIVVGNAQKELVRWYHEQNDHGRIVLTDKPEAAGVLEGLARHGLY
ncbi:sucrose-6F-phosphate phosphohydrolase-domain-containing protein [Scenedesmus sp. NREL 46B-D3]|nr:sucrose-6F-phosphate phosphohydrolase-domain-containing protein [Scenedesmus sp. NREL 46B-D3]